MKAAISAIVVFAVMLVSIPFAIADTLLHPAGTQKDLLKNVLQVTTIPPRPINAVTGVQFAYMTAGMCGSERQHAMVKELLKGNIPDFLRTLKPVRLVCESQKHGLIQGEILVMPDYLAIGSDENFLRIPLTMSSALTVANTFGFILPTPKMVDAVYRQSTCLLKPEPLRPGPAMRSCEYYLRHQRMIRAQSKLRGCELCELTSGHKKDVVLSDRLLKKNGRIAIYGWHKLNGEPIQPLSTVHGAEYADYSHGVRFISTTVFINGKPFAIVDVLQDPDLAPLLTYESGYRRLLSKLGITKKNIGGSKRDISLKEKNFKSTPVSSSY